MLHLGWFHSKSAWSKKSFYNQILRVEVQGAASQSPWDEVPCALHVETPKNEFWELRRTPPNKISCITLDYNIKYGILATTNKLWRIPFWHICHISPVVEMLSSCWLSGLDMKRWDNAQVVQCWPPESGTDLSEVEIICSCNDLASFIFFLLALSAQEHIYSWTSTSKPGLCVEKGLVVELVLGAKKERTSKRILNNLFSIAKKGTTPRRFSTSCFLL